MVLFGEASNLGNDEASTVLHGEWCGSGRPHPKHQYRDRSVPSCTLECPGVSEQEASKRPGLDKLALEAELEAWWSGLADAEIRKVVPKAIEYGADDLIEVGRELTLVGVPQPPRPKHDPWDGTCSKHLHGEPARSEARCPVCRNGGYQRSDDEVYAELGIWFYLVGKMARWRSAVRRGERPSDDTLHDIGVYVRMAQRVRETGRWP